MCSVVAPSHQRKLSSPEIGCSRHGEKYDNHTREYVSCQGSGCLSAVSQLGGCDRVALKVAVVSSINVHDNAGTPILCAILPNA